MSASTRKRVARILTVLILVGVSLSIVAIPTETLMSFIGTENAFVFMFFIAFIGSITTFASIPYPLIMLGMVAGGVEPLPLALVTALAVSTADSCTFVAARKGRALLSPKLQQSFEVVARWIERHPRMLTPGLVAYGTVAPLSNDFAVISLSLMRYSYMRVVVPLMFGNVAYNVGIAYLGVYAYDWVVGLV